MIISAILLPFIIQTIVIFIDEYYFHIKRGLPRWERIGHPLDTLSVLLCLLFVLFVPYSMDALKAYLALAIFSCLFVTKDEFVHKHHCPASEQWLHSLLFLNHPIVLTSLGIIWLIIEEAKSPAWVAHLDHSPLLHPFLITQTVFITLFLLYQIIYWNFIWKEKKVIG